MSIISFPFFVLDHFLIVIFPSCFLHLLSILAILHFFLRLFAFLTFPAFQSHNLYKQPIYVIYPIYFGLHYFCPPDKEGGQDSIVFLAGGGAAGGSRPI